MKNLEKLHYQSFENIKNTNEYKQDFWYGRDLQTTLEYREWRNFCKVIEKAKIACKGSNLSINDHFVDINKMVDLGSGSKRQIEDIQLSRYACYLIVQKVKKFLIIWGLQN